MSIGHWYGTNYRRIIWELELVTLWALCNYSNLIYDCPNIITHPNRLIWHFNLKKFRSNETQRVKISLACVFGFMAVGWPLIIYKAGIMGWIKFWLMPWLGYHFWVCYLLVFVDCMMSHYASDCHHPQQFFYAMKSLAGMHIMNQTLKCSMPKHITSNRSFLEVNKNCFPRKTHALFMELWCKD